MSDFKFTQEQMQDAMFRATDYGNIPFSMQKFLILQYIESLKKCSEPTERMYSLAEMQHSFEAGYKRSDYATFDQFFKFDQSLKERVADFQEFIQSLNTPKP